MSIKTCLAEIKPSDFEAIRSGLIGVVQQEGENLVISRFITNMEEARTPEQRAFALDYLSTDLQLSFPVSVALDLGDGSYRGFERCMNRLRETGWMGRYFADWEPYI